MNKRQGLLALLGALMIGIWSPSAQAQHANDRSRFVYAVSGQQPKHCSIWVDAIEFGTKHTVVTMHYASSKGGANLLPSTTLVCHLRGGKTKVLALQQTRGISMFKDVYTQFGQGDVFQAFFAPLPADDVARIKSVDLLEDASVVGQIGNGAGRVFNITNIRIDKKRQMIQ